ncbi:MAG TPA: hypothetical protein VGX25_21510 [Actinophytocola sp.]|uniref:hypothetical protein n=1 Tax=Actinophytocola sp. TaxID=1872138 RepID=UPI002DDCE9CA|nr:hypothetical protein [Actinophytocola sp.]HEV2781975.1 hypothetical protein [Actinophytocola sp.]
MLYLVLILVIAAFVLLIAALATANTIWAWVSVGISVVAAGLLVYDWLRGRRRVAATSAPREVEPVVIEDEPEPVPPAEEHRAEPPAEEPAAVDHIGDEEPGEETTDATDLLVISDLADEVKVVDEHPRYHLAQCTWLSGKQTIPLPVSEARELGFTPCARCGPDAVLAARHRAGRGATQ